MSENYPENSVLAKKIKGRQQAASASASA